MTRRTMLAMELLAFCFAALPLTNPAAGQAGDGWLTLFDGKNLDQWQGEAGDNATWRIEDNSIAVEKKNKDPRAIVSLVSKQSFADFELRAEFWVSDDANSGIYIRCTDPAGSTPPFSKLSWCRNVPSTTYVSPSTSRWGCIGQIAPGTSRSSLKTRSVPKPMLSGS